MKCELEKINIDRYAEFKNKSVDDAQVDITLR